MSANFSDGSPDKVTALSERDDQFTEIIKRAFPELAPPEPPPALNRWQAWAMFGVIVSGVCFWGFVVWLVVK